MADNDNPDSPSDDPLESPLEIQLEVMARALMMVFKIHEGMCIDLGTMKVIVYRSKDETIRIAALEPGLPVENGQAMTVDREDDEGVDGDVLENTSEDIDAGLQRLLAEEKAKEAQEKKDKDEAGP